MYARCLVGFHSETFTGKIIGRGQCPFLNLCRHTPIRILDRWPGVITIAQVNLDKVHSAQQPSVLFTANVHGVMCKSTGSNPSMPSRTKSAVPEQKASLEPDAVLLGTVDVKRRQSPVPGCHDCKQVGWDHQGSDHDVLLHFA
jgi:hypothetical protein